MDPKIFCAQFLTSAVIVFLGNSFLGNTANVPPAIKRAVYWILAAISGLGVQAVTTRTLTISGLMLAIVIQAVLVQEFIYRSTKKTAKNP